MQRPLCFVCALSDTPSTPKIVALIQQPVGFQSVRTGFAQKCSRCYRIDLAAIGVLVVNPPVKWGFVLERQSWGPSQNANDGWAGEQRQGLVMKKISDDCSGGGAFGLRGFWCRPEAGEGSASAASSAEPVGRGFRWRSDERLHLARHHAVGPQSFGRCLHRAALQLVAILAVLRRHLGREHPIPEPRGG